MQTDRTRTFLYLDSVCLFDWQVRLTVAVLVSAAEGYVQHVDHVAAGRNAEAVGLDVGSCHRHTV